METESDARQFPVAVINITNRCTLQCRHCFVFRAGNPNDPTGEVSTETLLDKILERKARHGIRTVLWMGGEPLLRPDVLELGVEHFDHNIVTTNGTLGLIDLPRTRYVVSLDGPPDINDEIRGPGSFDRVLKTLSRVPDDFGPDLVVQCVVTKTNEDRLEELIELLRPTRAEALTFSFYVPSRNDSSGLSWGDLKNRDRAVKKVQRLKEAYPDFVRNRGRSLELMLSENAKAVTDHCPSLRLILPLYLEGDELVSPFCCYGNDVDCDLCGPGLFFIWPRVWKPGNLAPRLSLPRKVNPYRQIEGESS